MLNKDEKVHGRFFLCPLDRFKIVLTKVSLSRTKAGEDSGQGKLVMGRTKHVKNDPKTTEMNHFEDHEARVPCGTHMNNFNCIGDIL